MGRPAVPAPMTEKRKDIGGIGSGGHEGKEGYTDVRPPEVEVAGHRPESTDGVPDREVVTTDVPERDDVEDMKVDSRPKKE